MRVRMGARVRVRVRVRVGGESEGEGKFAGWRGGVAHQQRPK